MCDQKACILLQMAIGHNSWEVTDGYWTQQLRGHRWLLDTTVERSQMAIGHNR